MYAATALQVSSASFTAQDAEEKLAIASRSAPCKSTTQDFHMKAKLPTMPPESVTTHNIGLRPEGPSSQLAHPERHSVFSAQAFQRSKKADNVSTQSVVEAIGSFLPLQAGQRTMDSPAQNGEQRWPKPPVYACGTPFKDSVPTFGHENPLSKALRRRAL
jgi:hypothetical protein